MTRSVRTARPRAGPLFVVVAAVLASAAVAGNPLGRINTRGTRQFWEFVSASLRPETDGDFLALVWRESLVTLSYAVLGTALAVVIGVVGALLLTRRTWQRIDGSTMRTWWLARSLAVLPRSVHEAVFGLLLLNVLGLDPLVAVLAIGLPFGAITAKVFADVLDDVEASAYTALRASGAGRLAALAYSSLASARAEFVSYAFYRFECAIRSAAILGIVGAGGLGFQLQLSFTSLRYEEVWTLLWALVALDGAADAWSGWVRRRAPRTVAADGETFGRASGRSPAVATAALVVPGIAAAWWWVDLSLSNLWSERTRRQIGDLVTQLWPPSLRDGWWTIIEQSIDTVVLSVLAMVFAFVGGVVVALFASGAIGPRGWSGALVRTACRGFLLVTRAIPPPVWAIVALFVLLPGPWPGAVALGVYNLGVLGRLLAEAVENVSAGRALALEAAGATRLQAAGYSTLPAVAGRFVSLALYRWEVTIRETVVVGVVGAGGLGRALDEELSAFAWAEVTSIIIALVVVALVVDLASTRLRRVAA